jgi:hypothetical protein
MDAMTSMRRTCGSTPAVKLAGVPASSSRLVSAAPQAVGYTVRVHSLSNVPY